MRKAFSNRHGVTFGRGQSVTDLMYADDSAVFAETEAEANDILHNIRIAAWPFGLKINADKTKVMTSDESAAVVHLEAVQLEQVPLFKYLGSVVQGHKIAATEDVRMRIGLAASAFGALSWCLWKKQNISVLTKMRVLRSLVLPVLLYGAESWTLLQADLAKLEAFQMRCLRQILGVSLRDRIRNESIRARCYDQPTIEEEIQKRRLHWFGHICRMEQNRFPQRLLWRGRPDGWKIQKSAPRKTWMKHIESDLRNRRLTPVEAKGIAMDRLRWKDLVRGIRDPAAPTAAYQLRGRPLEGTG